MRTWRRRVGVVVRKQLGLVSFGGCLEGKGERDPEPCPKRGTVDPKERHRPANVSRLHHAPGLVPPPRSTLITDNYRGVVVHRPILTLSSIDSTRLSRPSAAS